MKKVLIASIMFLFIFSFFTPSIKSNNGSNTLKLTQEQAIAEGEIFIGPFCANITPEICFIEPDGWFVMGVIVPIGG